jgi:hypothetical protein
MQYCVGLSTNRYNSHVIFVTNLLCILDVWNNISRTLEVGNISVYGAHIKSDSSISDQIIFTYLAKKHLLLSAPWVVIFANNHIGSKIDGSDLIYALYVPICHVH